MVFGPAFNGTVTCEENDPVEPLTVVAVMLLVLMLSM